MRKEREREPKKEIQKLIGVCAILSIRNHWEQNNLFFDRKKSTKRG